MDDDGDEMIVIAAVADGVEINQSPRRAVMLVEYGSLGTWRRWKTKK